VLAGKVLEILGIDRAALCDRRIIQEPGVVRGGTKTIIDFSGAPCSRVGTELRVMSGAGAGSKRQDPISALSGEINHKTASAQPDQTAFLKRSSIFIPASI
jgi:hypothetical protein